MILMALYPSLGLWMRQCKMNKASLTDQTNDWQSTTVGSVWWWRNFSWHVRLVFHSRLDTCTVRPLTAFDCKNESSQYCLALECSSHKVRCCSSNLAHRPISLESPSLYGACNTLFGVVHLPVADSLTFTSCNSASPSSMVFQTTLRWTTSIQV